MDIWIGKEQGSTHTCAANHYCLVNVMHEILLKWGKNHPLHCWWHPLLLAPYGKDVLGSSNDHFIILQQLILVVGN
jgi:hypothetical protein